MMAQNCNEDHGLCGLGGSWYRSVFYENWNILIISYFLDEIPCIIVCDMVVLPKKWAKTPVVGKIVLMTVTKVPFPNLNRIRRQTGVYNLTKCVSYPPALRYWGRILMVLFRPVACHLSIAPLCRPSLDNHKYSVNIWLRDFPSFT